MCPRNVFKCTISVHFVELLYRISKCCQKVHFKRTSNTHDLHTVHSPWTPADTDVRVIKYCANVVSNALFKCTFSMYIIPYKMLSECTLVMFTKCTIRVHSRVLFKCTPKCYQKVHLKSTFSAQGLHSWSTDETDVTVTKCCADVALDVHFKCTLFHN